jgi:adenine phosphoribosyltransferase
MITSMDKLIGSFDNIQTVKKGEYHYFIHPLSDGIPLIEPALIEAASECIMEILPDPDEYDMFLTAEAMGIPLTTNLSTKIGKPFSIARKREYGIKGEVTVEQTTGYSTSNIHLNLPTEPKRIVIVDDVLSTGGTLISITQGMKKMGWTIIGAVILFNKMGNEKEEMEKKLGYPIRTLLDVEMVRGSFKVDPSR